jgi:COX assembly protein 2
MHPALIPEKHPMCGKYMEALVQCRKENRFSRYLGACNDITYDLSLCLVKEKKVARADRQAQWHDQWRKKKEEDEVRLLALKEQAALAKTAEAKEVSSEVQL